MRSILYIAALLGIISCGNDENAPDNSDVSLIGEWRLIEQLIDPGDGSGDFVEVVSDKTINFFSDGTFQSTSIVCLKSFGPDEEGNGVYDVATNTLTLHNCAEGNPGDFSISYLFDKSDLIIHYPLCYEPCAHKYRKVSPIRD